MVPHAPDQCHSAGVHRTAPRGMEEVPATLWLWRPARTALDALLWQYQGIERLHRCYLLLADRLLHSAVRAHDSEEALLVVGAVLLVSDGGRRALHLLTRCPLSLWHYDWCGVIGRLCPLCHL